MTAVARSGADVAAVTDALRSVRDPELDESIVDLGFVTATTVDDGHAVVRLRLPTFFCAPNFAFLMVADAHDAVLAMPGISSVDIVLEDHFASEQINAGVSAGVGFVGSFPEHAAGELDELRLTFRRKAHVASMERACRSLTEGGGWSADELPRATIGDVPPGAPRDGLVRRRAEIGLAASADSPLLVNDDGTPIPRDQVARRLRMGRTVGVSIEGNSHICRGLLAVRYPESATAARGFLDLATEEAR
jgi:metal-sulfur cluster biosynthetic enzyme